MSGPGYSDSLARFDPMATKKEMRKNHEGGPTGIQDLNTHCLLALKYHINYLTKIVSIQYQRF